MSIKVWLSVPPVAVVLALAWFAQSSRPHASAAPVTHTVEIDGARFVPHTLTVNAGDSVVWVNRDPFPHTATSEDGRFDSHEIAPEKSWRYAAGAKGEFSYTCTLHPTMKGELRVR